jgi:dihydropyrimidinase
MYDLVVRSGRIVSPDGVVMGDLAVNGEKIAAIGQGLGPGRQEVDATGKVVFPGVVDAHVHMGRINQEQRSADDIENGTRAAVFGGVTTVIDFTVQDPEKSLTASLDQRQAEIFGKAHVDMALHGSFTSYSEANRDQIHDLVERGVTSLKIYTAYGDAGLQLSDREILAVAKEVAESGGLLMVHAENGDAVDFLSRGLERAGKTTAPYHEESRPDLVEAEAIYRVAILAQIAECPLYVAHLSSLRGLEVIRRFREEGRTIHAETCPQYLLLDKSRYAGEQGHRFIASPPLREAADRQALTRAVAEGEIEVMATDHCPFSTTQKDAGGGNFLKTPGGLAGVETLFPLMFSHLVALGDGGLTPRSNASLMLLSRVLAENPARLFGLAPRKGFLRAHADADFFIFDPNPIRRISAEDLHGKADWSPYEGMEVRGSILSVYLRGKRLVDGGQLYGEPGFGQFVEGKASSGDE